MDFLSPDNRFLFGTYSHLDEFTHRKRLEESLNVAVFLCGDKCLLPPSFVTQCGIVRAALNAKNEFLSQEVIVLPLRERTLGEFFSKKEREYSSVKSVYQGLFETEGRQFVDQNAHLVRKRFTEMGMAIAENWDAGPDESDAWEPIKLRLSNAEIQKVRKIPRMLKGDGRSVTWSAFDEFINPEIARHSFLIDQAIQHEYTA